MNYGETLAYWYLRLNGFFPVSNFVLPEGESNTQYPADRDLLAVRFPFVHERIGGNQADWDRNNFSRWGFSLDTETIGLIVEVKTGRVTKEDLKKAFEVGRLTDDIQRLGFWPRTEVESIVEEFQGKRVYRDDKDKEHPFAIGKLLIASRAMRDSDYLQLSLREIDEFLYRRMKNYVDSKWADRMFFPDELIQYIIWKCHDSENRDFHNK